MYTVGQKKTRHFSFRYNSRISWWIFRSTPPSRSDKVGLKCPSVSSSVRTSTKGFFDFDEIRCVGRGQRVMHDGMQHDPIQGQAQGHEPLQVRYSAIFKGYLPPHL